jgi:hypothetical protein
MGTNLQLTLASERVSRSQLRDREITPSKKQIRAGVDRFTFCLTHHDQSDLVLIAQAKTRIWSS